MIHISTGGQSSDLQEIFPGVLATIYLRFHVLFFFYFWSHRSRPALHLQVHLSVDSILKLKNGKQVLLFLSSYRIKSKILGERGMLWESTGINIIVPSDACGTTSRTHRKYVAPDSNYSRNKWNVKMPFIQYNAIILSTQ